MGKHFKDENKDPTDFVEIKGNVQDFDIETYPPMPPAPAEKYIGEDDNGF